MVQVRLFTNLLQFGFIFYIFYFFHSLLFYSPCVLRKLIFLLFYFCVLNTTILHFGFCKFTMLIYVVLYLITLQLNIRQKNPIKDCRSNLTKMYQINYSVTRSSMWLNWLNVSSIIFCLEIQFNFRKITLSSINTISVWYTSCMQFRISHETRLYESELVVKYREFFTNEQRTYILFENLGLIKKYTTVGNKSNYPKMRVLKPGMTFISLNT